MSENEFLDEDESYDVSLYANIERNLRSYSGFLSLLRELIQNSDDSSKDKKDVEVSINFKENVLIFKNNTIFSNDDWDNIRYIGSRSKDNDPEKTGRFGIGFTAIFKICDICEIHSKNKSKKLDLNTKSSNKWRTYSHPRFKDENITQFEFVWRFEKSYACKEINADIVDTKIIKNYIDETLNYIHEDLHFLKNITKICVYDNDILQKKIDISRKRIKNNTPEIEKHITTISINEEISKEYIIYSKNIKRHFDHEYKENIARRNELLLSIAIDTFENIENPIGHIFCTLPTEISSGFAFDINSDFQPDPNRKQLIFAKDDKGKYNLKLLSFIPELFHDILDDLKNIVPTKLFYNIISSKTDSIKELNNSRLYSDFIKLIQDGDSEIIFINEEWHSIINSKYMDKSFLFPFLERIKYPIIPDEYLEFSSFFKSIGVKLFNINDLIKLLQKEILGSVSFDRSVFESKEELESIFKYLSGINFKNNIHEIQNLNIFLSDDGFLHNKKQDIFWIPKSLNLIQDGLTITKMDNDIFEEFDNLLLSLGVQKFTPTDFKRILISDFQNASFPIELSQSKPYLDSIDKLIQIIHFLHPCLTGAEKYQELITDVSSGKQFFKNGEMIPPQLKIKIRQTESKFEFVYKLPLVLSTDNQLYSIRSITFNLDSPIKKRFAAKYGIQDILINPKIKELLSKYSLSRNLDLKTIFDYVENDSQGYPNDLLTLLYELIMEGESQLTNNVIKTKIKTLPIFLNNKGNRCSLYNNGKVMKLPGGYSDPIGVEEILDENLINSVPDFKQNILKSKRFFDIQEFNFDVYIKEYFIDIFEKEEVGREKKLQLVKELNEKFLELEKYDSNEELKEILKKTRLVYCQDSKFHYIHEKNLFFKSDELDNFFGKNYLYPDFDENNKYKYLLETIGLKKDLRPPQIIDHINTLIEPKKLDKKLFEKLRNILKYIDEKWESFSYKENFRNLAEIEWLPAINDNSKLYKPSILFTQDTKPFLSYINGILYLDSKTPKKEIVEYLALTNIPKIPTEKIIQNIRIAQEGTKLLDKHITIYTELNRRVENDKDRILKLKEFPFLYIKYEGEDQPRYFSYFEVFTEDYHKEFGYDYIGYLNSKFVGDCNKLIKLLDISEEPTEDTLKDILKKIEFKYKKNGYCISSDNDYKIIEKCLKRLNLYDILDEQFISELKDMHILCNSENKLITPIDAVLNDRPSLYDEFKIELKDYLINYPKEYYGLFDKLNIKRLSQIINKVLEDKPDLNQLTINEDFSNKLRDLSKVMHRIKAHKIKLKNDDWKSIDSKITVYYFDKLNVTRNVILHNREFRSNKKNINCYIDKDKDTNSFSKIYVNGSREDILKSIVKEIVEELHPELDTDFRGIIDSLLQKESSDKMNETLNEFDYPPIEDKDTLLVIKKQTEEEYKDKSGEEEDGTEHSEPPIEGSSKKGDNNNDIINKPSTQQKEELEDQQKMQVKRGSNEHGKGKMLPPTKNTNFNEELHNTYKKQYVPNKESENKGIEEDIEHMSPDEMEDLNKIINTEIDIEIEGIQSDIKKRQYKKDIEKLKDNGISKSEVKLWYKNKCQICGYTFKKEDGTNYSESVYLLKKSNRGIRHPANLVCLCPNHAAIIDHGIVEFIDLDDLKENKVLIKVEGIYKDNTNIEVTEEHEIIYNKIHFIMLKAMLKRGRIRA